MKNTSLSIGTKVFRFVAGLSVALLVPVASGQSPSATDCESFKVLLNKPVGAGLDRGLLISSTLHATEEGYFNVDVDGDDISDVLEGGCAASLVTADPCTLAVKMSTGKADSLELRMGEVFYLSRYKRKVYVVVSPASVIADRKTGVARKVSPSELTGRRRIYVVDGRGITQLCDRL